MFASLSQAGDYIKKAKLITPQIRSHDFWSYINLYACVSSRKQRCAVAQEVQISNSKDLREIPKGHPQRGAKLFYSVWPPDQMETFGPSFSTANESVPKIIINNTVNLFLKLQSAFW